MRRVLNKDEVIVYEFFVPKKEKLDGNQVRLMSRGILPTSSPGGGAFPRFPGLFCHFLAFFVSLWTLLRIRGFCVFDFGNSAQHQLVCHLMFFSGYSEFISGYDALPTVLNSLYMHNLTTTKLQQHNRFFFVGSRPLHSCL